MMNSDMPTERPGPEEFPLLNRLALSDEELGALTRQGFIRGEKRGDKDSISPALSRPWPAARAIRQPA